jgi:putative membrane protein
VSETRKPALIRLDADTELPTPAEAAPVPDGPEPPAGAAMQRVARLAGRPPSRLARWFWGLLGSFVLFVASLAAWNFVTGLIVSNPVLGAFAATLGGALVLVCVIVAIRELAAIARLARLDRLRRAAEAALADDDLGGARAVADRLDRLYSGRDALTWGRQQFAARRSDMFDAAALLELAEADLLAPLDAAASAEVEAAARQVATVTALVPLALADIAVALGANLRMIRRVAEVYGGRGGALETWRLTRAVLAHLVATGAVAVGDDMVGSLAGGGLLSKLSRRFGEGLVNGALTARVGVAAIEVCRPLAFRGQQRPRVTAIVKRAFTGLFSSA